ncbi:MAG: hypothetical protein ACI9RO_000789 [Alteromonas macleodii]|jgi:hypothetical protein
MHDRQSFPLQFRSNWASSGAYAFVAVWTRGKGCAWPGIGRTIWEALRLINNDVIYEVYGGFDKLKVDDDNPKKHIYSRFGGIYIEDFLGNELPDLQCIPSTVVYTY